MSKSVEISGRNFISITMADSLSEYPEALRTAWLDLAADRLYVSAALADLRILYQAAKKLEHRAPEGLPIIEYGDDRFVDVAWLQEIFPTQAKHFRLIEMAFRNGLFRQDLSAGSH